MMNRFTKNQDYLNSLFGNIYNGEALLVQNEMAHSLLDFIHKDDRSYSIPIRPQSVVLGSLKNPILRALFNPKINFKGFCAPTDAGTRIDLIRLFPEAKPEQFNYASQTIQNWFSELQLSASRDNISLMTSEDFDKATEVMQQRLSELDERSNQLKSKEHVRFEKCEVCGFNSYELFQEFLLPECIKYNIPVTEIDNFIKVG
jgi:hypothetical protein